MAPDRFAADRSLEELARRLRFLGCDVAGFGGVALEELLDLARRDGRCVLTLSRRHPRRFADVPVIHVPREDLAAQVRKVAATHTPVSPPFSRCALCNTALQRRLSFEARGEIPGRVLRRVRIALYCPVCGKWYWRGSHVDRMCEWLSATLDRPIEWPPDDPSVPA
jgi:uncharacterized protein with PIN domain